MRPNYAIKEIARYQFKIRYGLCVGAALLFVILGGGSAGGFSLRYNSNANSIPSEWWPFIIGAGVLGLLISAFVGGPVKVGYSKFTSCIYLGIDTGIDDMFRTGFRNNYWRSVGGMLWMDLFIWLWSLLFIIPGIVKSFAYFATPYILAEFPNVEATEALKISMRMTDGYKGDIFVLGLSFIGWQLLSGLTLGLLGILYVNPYYDVSMAGMYQELKMNALNTGMVRYEELMGYPAPPPGYQPPSGYGY